MKIAISVLKKLFIHSIIGAIIGYFILHPVSMIIVDISHYNEPSVWFSIKEAFSLPHLKTGLFYALLGISIGIIHHYYIEKIFKFASKIKNLEKLLPVCAWCKKIRDDSKNGKGKGQWITMEKYISKKDDADFTHGMCPECEKKQMEDLNKL